MDFEIITDKKPTGSQPDAIEKLVQGAKTHRIQTLLGITGSGKTFTISHVIQQLKMPTLVLAHNKTLAAQLFLELKELFPNNRVEYFVSYYDYYQPESYLPSSDTYIEKDSKVNEKIEQLRLRATASLLSRKDVIIVASVSCIYGLGSPENFEKFSILIKKGKSVDRSTLIKKLVSLQYERNDNALSPGKFRVKGDTIDLILGYDEDIIRIEYFGDEIESIRTLDHLNYNEKFKSDSLLIFPAKHYMVSNDELQQAVISIKKELEERLPTLPLLESHRLKQRTLYDLEMIQELGYCNGIENYSRHFENRKEGEAPFCLLDYFPQDFLLVIDESHVTIPQLHGMYKGDRSRKQTLVEYGFRLPSALDNRPLKFEEVEAYFNHVIFVSATPSLFELKSAGQVVEQIIRPTGLLDPEVEVRPLTNQIKDAIQEIHKEVAQKGRVLVTTLTKKMAEEIARYLTEQDVRAKYLHSEITTIDRNKIIQQLRLGVFDCLVGVNLLREGLDLPEVSLVVILDADKEGFLRNERSLIQTIGRAARNDRGHVILYADKMTISIKGAVKITNQRRQRQLDYNKKHGITPKTIHKSISSVALDPEIEVTAARKHTTKEFTSLSKDELYAKIVQLETEMKIAAERLNFEEAIRLRDEVAELKAYLEK